MPVSLEDGTTIRTPEFFVKDIEYHILLRVNRGLPFGELTCKIGGNITPHKSHCALFQFDLVVGADWRVLDGERVVAQGKATDWGDMAWSGDLIDRYLGDFTGEPNKKYVVEVKFTKDGTSLGKLKPRLVVRMQDSWF